MYHDKKGLAPAKAVLKNLRTKADGDVLDVLTQKIEDMTDATMERIKDGEKKMADINKSVDAHEKRLSRSGGGSMKPQSWGQQFVSEKSADLTELAGSNAGKVQLNVKALTTGATSGGPIDIPMRDQTVMLPQQRLPVRAILNVIGTDSGTVEYANQTTRANAADMVAEGAAKPESVYEWELLNVPTRVIAHFTKASNQIMSDAPQVQGLIDSELRYGLNLKEEQQILFGTGTGSQINGLCPNATAYVNTSMTGYTPANSFDDIGVAILQCTLANHMPTAIVMHPSDWWIMRLTKDSDGKYILGNPQDVVTPNLFGLPVITTLSMTADKFLLGDFQNAATLYDRWQPRVEVGFENDDFTKNLVTIRAEERIAQAIKQPDGLIFGDFGRIA